MQTKYKFVNYTLLTSLIVINLTIVPIGIFSIDRSAALLIITITLSSLNFLIISYYFISLEKIPVQIFIFSLFSLGIFIFPLIVSIVRNHPIEYIPSAFRYISYIFTFLSFFWAAKLNIVNIKNLYVVTSFILIVCTIFSTLQVLNAELPFMNGAHRLSSIYGPTPAGFALLMLFCALFYSSVYFFEEAIKNKKIIFLFALLSTYQMYATQSRQALITLFVFIFFFLIVKSSWLFKLIYTFVIVIAAFIFHWVLMNTSIFPRITDMLTRSDTDSSTQTRKNIIDVALSNLNDIDNFLGIGLGGFNQFYYSKTGEFGVAAHNDLLLFYVEGGYISFLSYILFLIAGIFLWFKAYKRYSKRFLVPLSLFVGIYIFSFLNNPYYYPQTQVLMCAVLGVYLYYYTQYRQNYILRR
ncbi:TPA: O-antigen ligase family protein [Providencia alcalifaciens]